MESNVLVLYTQAHGILQEKTAGDNLCYGTHAGEKTAWRSFFEFLGLSISPHPIYEDRASHASSGILLHPQVSVCRS